MVFIVDRCAESPDYLFVARDLPRGLGEKISILTYFWVAQGSEKLLVP
jgi:hypothetical protein